MTVVALLIAALAATAPTGAPPRDTSTPERMLSELGMAPDERDVDDAITAAQAHPLGSDRNPVRVGGPDGERGYIARLRCSDESRPRVGTRANVGIGAFGTIVDAYPLDCGQAAPGQMVLHMDMYHSEHREERAPPGFTIAPR